MSKRLKKRYKAELSPSQKGAELRESVLALPPELNRFKMIVDVAFPEHIFDDDDGEEDDCQCRQCQEDRGELGEIPEPVIYEIFY